MASGSREWEETRCLLRASEWELEAPGYRLDHYVLLLDAEFAKFGKCSVEQCLYYREVPPRVYYADPKLRAVVFRWCGCAFNSHLCRVRSGSPSDNKGSSIFIP